MPKIIFTMADLEAGLEVLKSTEKSASAYYEWFSSTPENHRNSIDILSDGILRQKDYSALFGTDAGETLLPLETIDRINIFSNVIFDNRFLETAMKSGVCVNLFSRDYSFIGRFTPAGPIKDQSLIFSQLTEYNDAKKRLNLAKEFDLASVHNLRLNIRYHNKQNESDTYARALGMIDLLYDRMKECPEYESLLLIEAQIRGLYYGCFDEFIRNRNFSFEKRTKQPPENEINSMMSFGNVVLYNYIATRIYESPLDIRVGYLHATNRREESLNLDIAEIFRPLIVDRVLFALVNRGEILPEYFIYQEDGAVYLNESGKKVFLREFYDKLNTTLTVDEQPQSYAALIDREIQKLTRHFRKGEKYRAFRQVR